MLFSISRPAATVLSGCLAVALSLSAAPAEATKLRVRNVAQLIDESETIITGVVTSVTDGFDPDGVPYTEVTIAVSRALKGHSPDAAEHTFRQFGLLTSRTMPNGLEYLAVAPEGFARWHEGESVFAFLYRPAAQTGFQTTAGLAQGKLTFTNGRLVNEFQNAGLFHDLVVADGLLTPEERDMLRTPGAVDADTFLGLVQRAVSEGWIENGEMR